MNSYSYPDLPVLTLSGNVHSQGSLGVNPYGINDSSGLGPGPTGSNVFRTYRTTIENIEAQEHGDSSVRNTKGPLVGGQYNGIDVTVGDFVTNQDATRIFKISDIYKKTETSVDILYEDVWMSIAKSRADRVNKFPSGTTVIIFKVSEDNIPLISWTGDGYFTNPGSTNPGSNTSSIDRLQTYFRVYQPSKHFTFYSSTGANLLSRGDLVTATGGTGNSSLIKIDSKDQIVVGQVYQIFGEDNVIINSTERIITNFPDPPGLTAGMIADVWYSDESGGYNLTSDGNRPVFYQLTNAIPTHIVGETSSPTFDQTSYNLLINGIEVIPTSATGPTGMALVDMISNINSSVTLTHTIASDDAGRLRLDREDGGDIVTSGTWVNYDTVGREIYSTSRGTPPYVMQVDSSIAKGSTAGFTFSVLDEGNPIGNYTTMNFIGNEVLSQDSGIPGQVDVYILPPTFASHYDTLDGTTIGTVSESLSRSIVRISTPTIEGSPYFKTGGWAATNQSATNASTPAFTTAEEVTGFGPTGGGDSVINVNVYDADGVNLLASYTTPFLNGNGTNSSGGISVTLSNYAPDASKFKARVTVSVNMDTVFSANNLDGGRYHIVTEHITDTATDGGDSYTHTQTDVFYDTDNSTPNINGFMTLIESTNPSRIITKHISGVEYYTLTSEFETTVTDIDDFNENTQGRDNSPGYNFRILAPEYGLPQRNLEAWNLGYGTWNGTWTNFWDLQAASYEYLTWPITATNFRYRGPDANGFSDVYDPWNDGNNTNTPGASILVDTYNDNSTRLGEDFDGESMRLRRGPSVYSTWDSTEELRQSITGTGLIGTYCDACVVGSNLVRPDRFFLTDPSTSTIEPELTTYKANKGGINPDYSLYSNIAVYHRKFSTSFANNNKAISSFVMTFGGVPAAYDDFSHALESSVLRVYIRRINVPNGQIVGTYGFNANPLSLHGPLFSSGAPAEPFDDGASGVDTPGARIRTVNGGNSVPGTFGTGSPAAEGFWMELQILDPNIKIDYINVTLVFSDGATDSVPV